MSQIIAVNIRCLYPDMLYYGEIVTDGEIHTTDTTYSITEAKTMLKTLKKDIICQK